MHCTNKTYKFMSNRNDLVKPLNCLNSMNAQPQQSIPFLLGGYEKNVKIKPSANTLARLRLGMEKERDAMVGGMVSTQTTTANIFAKNIHTHIHI